MKKIIDKRKLYLVILLSLLFALCLGAGLYFLVNGKDYDIDKYEETVSWCDTKETDKALDIDCKALLLDIRNLEDSSSCFDVQVITKDKELKDLSICEKGDTLSYTNEILEYKKLMPIDMIFTYSKEGITNSYSFSSVSLTKLDDTYVQGIVNEDIANLVTIDPSSTTIQNSVDFCPKPETLSDYITEENKTKYAEYFNNNLLSIDEYNNQNLYTIEDSTINLLFTCESKTNLGYIPQCTQPDLLDSDVLNILDSSTPLPPQWDKPFDDEDRTMLKQISYLYDSTDFFLLSYLPYIAAGDTENKPMSKFGMLNEFVKKMSLRRNISQEVYCSMYSLLNKMKNSNEIAVNYQNKMEAALEDDISQVHSIMCLNITDGEERINRAGLYLKVRYSPQPADLEIYTTCSNLQKYMK